MRECHPWAPIIDASRNPSIIPIASPVVPLAVMIHSTVVMEAPFRSALKRTLCEITSTLSQRLESGGIESGDESGESGDGNRGTPYLFPFLWWAGDPPRTEGVANKGPVPRESGDTIPISLPLVGGRSAADGGRCQQGACANAEDDWRDGPQDRDACDTRSDRRDGP